MTAGLAGPESTHAHRTANLNSLGEPPRESRQFLVRTPHSSLLRKVRAKRGGGGGLAQLRGATMALEELRFAAKCFGENQETEG